MFCKFRNVKKAKKSLENQTKKCKIYRISLWFLMFDDSQHLSAIGSRNVLTAMVWFWSAKVPTCHFYLILQLEIKCGPPTSTNKIKRWSWVWKSWALFLSYCQPIVTLPALIPALPSQNWMISFSGSKGTLLDTLLHVRNTDGNSWNN